MAAALDVKARHGDKNLTQMPSQLDKGQMATSFESRVDDARSEDLKLVICKTRPHPEFAETVTAFHLYHLRCL